MEHNTLKANNIKVGYGNGNILNYVSIHIPENKISVILGSNGSENPLF